MPHPCHLVPRALWPRWDRPERVATLLEFCQAVGADEVMVFPTGQLVAPGHLDADALRDRAARVREFRELAAARGIAVMVNDWAMLDDFGQAAGTPHEHDLPWAVDITGQVAVGYACPLSPQARDKAVRTLLAFGEAGVAKVFLDDEIRHDWHPAAGRPEGSHFCFCDLHLAAFARHLGRAIVRDELAERLQSGGPDDRDLRARWLAFKRQVVLDFITHVRQRVHARYPSLRLGQMTTFIHFQTIGGLTFAEQVAAWAGPLRPLCRPAQGWYGDHVRAGLVQGMAQTMFTIAQLPAGTEIYSEVDSGSPWTQLESSARMSADFQVKANLLLNIKRHSLLYLGEGPDDAFLRRRFVRQLQRSQPLFDAMAETIPADATRRGVQFLMSPHLGAAHPLRRRGPAGDAADPQGITGAGIGQPGWPRAFATLARSGIAVDFADNDVAVLTGGIAPAIEDELPQILATRHLIIDGPAARDLEQRGLLSRFGVSIAPCPHLMNERLEPHPLNGADAGEVVALSLVCRPWNMFPYQPVAGAGVTRTPVSRLMDTAGRDRGLGIVMVDGLPEGRRAVLLPFDLGDNPWGYTLRKRQWLGLLTFLAGRAPTVWIDDAMEVWPLVYRRDGDNRLWVGLINFGHDAADDCALHVDGQGPVRYLAPTGQLVDVPPSHVQADGRRLSIRLDGAHVVPGLGTVLLVVG